MTDERAVQQVLAKYTRAVDALDGNPLSTLFTEDGKVEVYYGTQECRRNYLFYQGKKKLQMPFPT